MAPACHLLLYRVTSRNIFRIMESLEKTSQIIKSNHQPNTTTPLNHVPKCHIYTFFEHLQGQGLHHFPGQPVPMPDHSFSKEIFPNVQPKPPLMHLEALHWLSKNPSWGSTKAWSFCSSVLCPWHCKSIGWD